MLTNIETPLENPPAREVPEEETWDIEITAKPGLLDVDLRELWSYRDLVAQFVRRDFVGAYKQTVLGPLWHLLEPLVTTITYAIIFGAIAQISTNGLPRIWFYMSGLTLWTLFSNTLLSGSSTFASNAGVFGKVYFPRLVVPIASTINNMIAFAFQFSLLLVLIVVYYVAGADIRITWYALLTPVVILMVGLLGYGLGILVSPLVTHYRDLGKLLSVSMKLLMFATPIIYPLSKVSERYRWIMELNPMATVVEMFRYIWFGVGTFSPTSLVYTGLFTLVVAVWGSLVFSKGEKTAMDIV